jgi:hypothetical protein
VDTNVHMTILKYGVVPIFGQLQECHVDNVHMAIPVIANT